MRKAVVFMCVVWGVSTHQWCSSFIFPYVTTRVAVCRICCAPNNQIHFPAVGFFHNQHNVCFNEYKQKITHFSQIRLPPDDPRFVYHDIYSQQYFLSYEDYHLQVPLC